MLLWEDPLYGLADYLLQFIQRLTLLIITSFIHSENMRARSLNRPQDLEIRVVRERNKSGIPLFVKGENSYMIMDHLNAFRHEWCHVRWEFWEQLFGRGRFADEAQVKEEVAKEQNVLHSRSARVLRKRFVNWSVHSSIPSQNCSIVHDDMHRPTITSNPYDQWTKICQAWLSLETTCQLLIQVSRSIMGSFQINALHILFGVFRIW